RIQKYMSEKGIASRREAERLIMLGLVTVNGKVVREMGVQIDPEKDKVAILPAAEKKLAKKTTIVIYKPKEIVSSREKNEGKTIYELFPRFAKLNIVGRLDKSSEGLLMLTDDGVIAKAVTGEAHLVEKEYKVTVREEIRAGRLKVLERGIEIDGVTTLSAKTEWLDNHTFKIILREGRKHQIRRMCEALRLTVTRLLRLRIGPVSLGKMKPGEFRVLSAKEVKLLKK
ncbi:hypothetical protein A2608_00765, partial [Candidatus Azambacteria bacterium RIFOXYD1_FULL_44_10]